MVRVQSDVVPNGSDGHRPFGSAFRELLATGRNVLLEVPVEALAGGNERGQMARNIQPFEVPHLQWGRYYYRYYL